MLKRSRDRGITGVTRAILATIPLPERTGAPSGLAGGPLLLGAGTRPSTLAEDDRRARQRWPKAVWAHGRKTQARCAPAEGSSQASTCGESARALARPTRFTRHGLEGQEWGNNGRPPLSSKGHPFEPHFLCALSPERRQAVPFHGRLVSPAGCAYARAYWSEKGAPVRCVGLATVNTVSQAGG